MNFFQKYKLTSERIKSLLLYVAKCITGTLIVYLLSSVLDYKDISWCLISVILVISPESKDSMALAFTRIKANIIGASVGVICLLIHPTNMWMLSFALGITLTLCYIFRLDSGERSALAATIIIMLHVEGGHIWNTALVRVIAVLAGSALGLLITLVFHFAIKSQVQIKDNNNQEA